MSLCVGVDFSTKRIDVAAIPLDPDIPGGPWKTSEKVGTDRYASVHYTTRHLLRTLADAAHMDIATVIAWTRDDPHQMDRNENTMNIETGMIGDPDRVEESALPNEEIIYGSEEALRRARSALDQQALAKAKKKRARKAAAKARRGTPS